MDFAEQINLIHQERLSNLEHPWLVGFKPNSRHIIQKTMSVPVSIIKSSTMQDIGMCNVCYSDQDPNENVREAEFIRIKKWDIYDVGWMWVYLDDVHIFLAKINPADGPKEMCEGWITEWGEYVINMDTLKEDII